MQPTWLHLFTYVIIVFHWPWFTPTQCLFFIGHGLHPLIFYTSDIMPMHCLFSIGHGLPPHIFYASGIMLTYFCFSGSHFVGLIYNRMYLSCSSARFTTSQGNITPSHRGNSGKNHSESIRWSWQLNSVWFVSFMTLGKTSGVGKLCLMLPKYCKTFDSP